MTKPTQPAGPPLGDREVAALRRVIQAHLTKRARLFVPLWRTEDIDLLAAWLDRAPEPVAVSREDLLTVLREVGPDDDDPAWNATLTRLAAAAEAGR